jgi:hypothetical protein
MDTIEGIAARLRVVVRLLYRRVQTETGEGSPTRSEAAALAWLDERGPMTLGALAELEQVRQQSMSQSVDALQERGWATRRTDVRSLSPSPAPAGRRSKSPAGCARPGSSMR